MACVSALSSGTKTPEIADNMKCSSWTTKSDKQLEKEESPKSEPESYSNGTEKEGEQSTETISNVCVNEKYTNQSKKSSDAEDKHSSDITNCSDNADSGKQELSSDGEQSDDPAAANGGNRFFIPEESQIIIGVLIPSKSDIIRGLGKKNIKTLLTQTEKSRKITKPLMNIIANELDEESSDRIGYNSFNKMNLFVKGTNLEPIEENYRSKNPHSKNEMKKPKVKKISNRDDNIAELGDRLVKLDLAAHDDLISATSSFQKMNICAITEVSDEENASDDDNDSDISNDDQDTAFEGDDENDDDDYEGSFKECSGIKLPEKGEKKISQDVDDEEEDEYISRNPIASNRSNDRFHPYHTESQITSEPIISADELIENFTLSEKEKTFLISALSVDELIETFIDAEKEKSTVAQTCPIDGAQTAIHQETFCNGDKFRDIDEQSMTSDLGRSVVADSPQSMPSPSDSYSDHENIDHLSEFYFFQNIPTPDTTMPPMLASGNQNPTNHITKKGAINENIQHTYLPPTSISLNESLPLPNAHANARTSANNSTSYNQLTVGYLNNDASRKKAATRSNYSKSLLQNGGTVHVQKKPSAKQNVVLIERNVNVPVQALVSQPLINVRQLLEPRPIQPRQQGPLLYEQEMNRTAAERLQNRSKKLYSPTDFEWIRLLVSKPGQTPESKHFFIDFLKGNNQAVMEERVLAHSNYIKSALQKPDIFCMRDPVTGDTPLRIAAFNHNSKPLIARCIADFIVDTTGKSLDFDDDEKGETILHKLACMGESHVEVLAELLHVKMLDNSQAFDINKPNINGMTPLILAVVENFKHSFHTIEQLIKHGARIEFTDKNGRNCLHYAVEKIQDNVGFEILKKILQSLHSSLVNGKLNKIGHAAAINKCDDRGYTPLHLAIKDERLQINEQLKLIQLLKDFGAEPKIKCCGHLPLLLVENTDRKEIIRPVLQKNGNAGRPVVRQ